MANTPRREYFEETERYFRESEVKDGTRGERVEFERNVYPPQVGGVVSHFPPRSLHTTKPSWSDKDWAPIATRPGAWNRTMKSLSSRVLREEHYRPPALSPSQTRHSYFPPQNTSYALNGYSGQSLPRAHLYSPTPEELANLTASNSHYYHHTPPAPPQAPPPPPKTPRKFYYRSGDSGVVPSPPQQLPPRARVVPIDQRFHHRAQEEYAEHPQQQPQYPIKIHVDLPVTNEPLVAVTEYQGAQTHPHHRQHVSVEKFSPPVRAGSPQPLIGIGEIINAAEGFTIRLDTSHFKSKNIRIGLTSRERILTVEGERIDKDEVGDQTLRRSFSRKYSIPEDIKLRTIRAMLADDGVLTVKGARKTWKETEIDVQFEPPVADTASQISSASGSALAGTMGSGQQNEPIHFHPILAQKKPYKVFGMEAGDHSSTVTIAQHRDEPPRTVQFAKTEEEKSTEGDESFHV